MRDYRERLRAAGLRPIQIWVPDVASPRFAAALRRQVSSLDSQHEAVMIGPGLADLALSAQASVPSATPNDTVPVTYTVTNPGTASAPGVTP